MQPTITRDSLLSQTPSTYIYSGSFSSVPALITDIYFSSIEIAQSSANDFTPLTNFSHPNAPKLLAVYPETEETGYSKAVIVTELFGRDLFTEIEERRKNLLYWCEQDLLEVLLCLCTVLEHAQAQSIPHRDVNPSNVYVEGRNVKLGNFVPATASWERVSNYTKHTAYLSPEAQRHFTEGGSFDLFKADLFSLGVTLVHMTFLEQKLNSEGRTDQEVETVLAALGSYPMLQYCLACMLKADPASRPSAGEICRSLETYFSYSSNTVPEALASSYAGERSDIDPASIPLSASYQGYGYQRDDGQWPATGVESQRSEVSSVRCCQQCSGPITDSAWTENLPPEYQNKPNYKDNFCSFQCLSAFCKPIQTTGVRNCDFCERPMINVPEDYKIALSCGHVCHFKRCLFWYLAEKSDNFTKKVNYSCPKCPTEIPQTLILRLFGGPKQYAEMQNKSNKKGCHSCPNKKTVRKLECMHRVCEKCLSDVVNGGVKYCQLCFKPYEIAI